MGDVRTFVREVDKELRWLAERLKVCAGVVTHVPSCLALYGCVRGRYSPPTLATARPYRDEADGRTVAEILGESDPAHPELETRPQPNRRKRRLVSYHPPLPVFGDAPGGEPVRLLGTVYQSLTALIAAQARDLRSLKTLLGLPEPCQPFYFHGSFFVPRCKAWQCAEHQSSRPVGTSAEERAFAAIAWSKLEPLSTPPICSCREPTRVKKWVAALLRAVELEKLAGGEAATVAAAEPQPGSEEVLAADSLTIDSPTVQSPVLAETPAVPDTPAQTPAMAETPTARVVDSPRAPPVEGPQSAAEELEALERSLLTEAGNCKACGGLCYFPFSFIEVFLHSHMNNLHDFQAVFADLPPNTDVCCDGPHISTTICCKSPEHEWEVFQALSRKQLTQAPIIYDVCSQCFIPGVPTRPGQKRLHEQEVPFRTPRVCASRLSPPPQRFLNCSKVVPLPPDHQTVTSLAARRPFCLRVRQNVDLVQLGNELRAERGSNADPELVSALKQWSELQKKLLQLERDVETLSADSLATEVCTPWTNNNSANAASL